jgi:hypothetical protein
MNIPDHVSESKKFLGFKILKFFDADPDPGSGIFSIRDGKKRSASFRDFNESCSNPFFQHIVYTRTFRTLEKIVYKYVEGHTIGIQDRHKSFTDADTRHTVSLAVEFLRSLKSC